MSRQPNAAAQALADIRATNQEEKEPEWTPPERPLPYPIEEHLQQSALLAERASPPATDWEQPPPDRSGDATVTAAAAGSSATAAGGALCSDPGVARARSEAIEAEAERLQTQEEYWATRLPARWMLAYCLNLQVMGVPHMAARAAKVNPPLVDKWAAKCPEFSAAIKQAQRNAAEGVVAALRISAEMGDLEPIVQRGVLVFWRRRKSVQAAELLLQGEMPEKYGRNAEPAPAAGVTVAMHGTPAAVADQVRRLAALLYPAGKGAVTIETTARPSEP